VVSYLQAAFGEYLIKELQMIQKFVAAALAASAVAMVSGGAQARIQCDGQYQIVQGNAIATPYCQDNYLAQVARGYGMKVSMADVRIPSKKQEVCQFIGHDARLSSICSGWRVDPNSGRFR
jgi:hypothetical protein